MTDRNAGEHAPLPQSVDAASLIDDSPMSRAQWIVILLCASLSALDGFDVQAMAFAAPKIVEDWSIPKTLLGSVFSASLIGGILGGFLIAPLGDRYGPKRVAILSTFFFGLLTLGTVFASNVTQLIVMRTLAGIGFGSAMPAIIALLAAFAPRTLRARIVTVGVCSQMLGAIVGGLISVQLVESHGWQSIFVLGGLAPLVIAALALRLIPEPPAFLAASGRISEIPSALARLGKPMPFGPDTRFIASTTAPPTLSPRILFEQGRGPGTLLLWLSAFCGVMFLYFLANWVPSILRDHGVDLQRAIFGGVVLNSGGICGAIMFSVLVSRFSPYRLVSFGLLAGAAAACVLAAGNLGELSLFAFIYLSGLFGLGAQYFMPVIIISFYPPHLHSTAIGYSTGISRIGAAIGPLVGSLLLAIGVTMQHLFFFAAAIGLVAGAGVWGMWRAVRLLAARDPEPVPAR